ncbi:MAG: hypothetical protein Q9182_003565 [Xanthomendoza sp. 2 TL-2023]
MSAIEGVPLDLPGIEGTISSASPPASPPPQPTPCGPIVLQVGEQRFYVHQNTLQSSQHLESITSGRWDHNKQPDGSFFIDADPEVFKYILRFLRHGLYPLCYDKSKGHDFAMYAAIHKLADYLMVEGVMGWLSKQQYLQAVKIETSTHVVEDNEAGQLAAIQGSNIEVRHYACWRNVKKYVCPRGIVVHYGIPGRCGKDCRKAQGDADDLYEDAAVLSTLVVTEKTVFNQQLCVDEQ